MHAIGRAPITEAEAARLCACGAVILSPDPLPGGNARPLGQGRAGGREWHDFAACDGADGIRATRPNACPCDACHGRRIAAGRER